MTANIKRAEGVNLSQQQSQYLLPHFLMMLIGKPGSGKSNLVRELVTQARLYKGKFNKILIVSPSAQKMGIPMNKNDMTTVFDLDWIYSQIAAANKKQIKRMQDIMKVQRPKYRQVINPLTDVPTVSDDIINRQNMQYMPPEYIHFNNTQRFFTAETMVMMTGGCQNKSRISDVTQANQGTQGLQPHMMFQKTKKGAGTKNKVKQSVKNASNFQFGIYKDVDDIEKQLVSKLSPEQQAATAYNMLIIMDDVVSEIKANEYNSMQSQLFFNRRHLIANGVISVIVVSQKYTLIPSRIRSNANWMVLFRLNPVDFDNVYKDVIMLSPDRWQGILDKVFQVNSDEMIVDKASKRYDNLGIWVEYDMFFHNFKLLANNGSEQIQPMAVKMKHEESKVAKKATTKRKQKKNNTK